MGGRPRQHLGRDSRAGPWEARPRRPAATTATGPRAYPGHCVVQPLPAQAFSTARPTPGTLTPDPLAASLYCARVDAPRLPRLGLRLRLRTLSRRPPTPGHRLPRPAGRPAPRPRQPQPTRELWGRSRPHARPGQSSPYLRAEEQPRKWAGDWSGLLKGPPPTALGKRGSDELTGRVRGGTVKSISCLPNRLYWLHSSLHLLISYPSSLATSEVRTCPCQRDKLRHREPRVCHWANSLKLGF